MALQLSINEMTGTLGNLTYYKSKDGYRVKRKSTVSKTKILSSPGNVATRQNMAEFQNASAASELLRKQIRPLTSVAKDSKMISRLLKKMKTVAQSDATNTRGNRNVSKGDLTLLNDFNFNADSKLGAIFYAPYTTTIDRVGGSQKIDIPSFQSNIMVPPPQGATHFKIFSGGSEIDFTRKTHIATRQESAAIPCDNTATTALSLVHPVTPNTSATLLLMLGVQFYQMVNGVLYPFLNKTKNPLAIISVNP